MGIWYSKYESCMRCLSQQTTWWKVSMYINNAEDVLSQSAQYQPGADQHTTSLSLEI